jgi:excisionase family DNA binding protein
MQTQTTPYLSLAEVAATLKVTRQTIRRYIRIGRIPRPLRPCGKLLWHRETFERWLAAMAQEQGAGHGS